jgi:glutamate racemase
VTDGRPVGLFDSGIGGVPVLAEVRRLLPAEDLIYYADTAHFPYGSRPAQEIRRLAAAATGALLAHDAKLIVVACNTASTMALGHLRELYGLPFVGMVPAVKPASALSQVGRVGVLATEGTVQTEVLADLIQQFANGASVATAGAPGLADLVEHGASDRTIQPVLTRQMQPLIEAGSDVYVLGCTHYFFLRHLIEPMVPNGSSVIDAAEPVARRVRQVLDESGMLAEPDRQGTVEYLASGDRQELERVLEHWRSVGYEVP